jgi:hypothetical protein
MPDLASKMVASSGHKSGFFLDFSVLRSEFLGSGIMHYLDVQMLHGSNC